MRFGEYLVALLERHGVSHVFGIPGVHTAELYRGLAGSSIRHVTPRHEQGAGFMADGYARLTGKPGVCFVISGPGVTNIATAMAQAYQDSIPMLVISSVAATGDLGRRRGTLHELNDQQGLASKLAASSRTIPDAESLARELQRAFIAFASERPRPVHIEIPLDVLQAEVPVEPTVPPPPSSRTRVESALLARTVALLRSAHSPLILAGGGASRAAPVLREFAERLDAPVVMTVNARGVMPFRHPLAIPASPSLDAVRSLVASSDVVLAVGTEIGPTDYDMYVRGGFSIPGTLIRIDVDGAQITLNAAPDVPLVGDAGPMLDLLLQALPAVQAKCNGSNRAEATRRSAFEELSPAMQRQVSFLDEIRDTLPGVVIAGDSTQAVYAGNLCYEPDAPSSWFNSATGYGTLGYALPAAIGAKLAAPERPVVCLAGDGGLQYTIAELGSAMDAGTPVIVLCWNNRGYGEIKRYFVERGIAPIGVDLTTPDFCAIARAYGAAAERLETRSDLPHLLREASARDIPTLIEMDEAVVMG